MSTLSLFFTGTAMLLVSIGVHEFAHAWTANYLGDSTARYKGRVTLDPLAHLDPIGTMMILFTAITGVGIGWGKPVPVIPGNLRNRPLVSLAITASAGPLSNLLQAALAAALLQAVYLGFPAMPTGVITASLVLVVVSGIAALLSGGALLYRWYRQRANLQNSAFGDFTWKVVDPATTTPLWENEALLKQIARAGLGGALLFGFLADPVILLRTAIYMNVALALFNLIPLGPLDGHKVLRGLLLTIRARWSLQVANFLDRIEPNSGLILLGLLMIDRFIPILTGPLWGGTRLIAGLLGA
jgi:Zn-dependent protease